MFHVKPQKAMKKETNKAWLELARDYMETLYETGAISEEELKEALQDYDQRLAAI